MKLYEFKNHVAGSTLTHRIVSESMQQANKRNNEMIANCFEDPDYKKRALDGEFCCEIKITRNIEVIHGG